MDRVDEANKYLALFQFHVDAESRLLICYRTQCKYALSCNKSQPTSHLRDNHGVGEDARQGLTRYLNSLFPDGFQNPATAPSRQDGSPEDPKLQFHEGFACRQCPYRTIYADSRSRHLSQEHGDGRQISRRKIDCFFDRVFLQSWTRQAKGGGKNPYWKVVKDGCLIASDADETARSHFHSLYKRECDRSHLEDQNNRSCRQDTISQTLTASRPWIDRTHWPSIYEGINRRALVMLAAPPDKPSRATARTLIEWQDENVLIQSPLENEQKIASLGIAVDLILDRCEETMMYTSRNLLCWLRSTEPYTCHPKPFRLVALKQSKKRYRSLWKRFIAFTFRAYQIHKDNRHKLLGIRFKKDQLQQLKCIWEHEAWKEIELDQGLWSDPSSNAIDREISHVDGKSDNEEENEESEVDETTWQRKELEENIAGKRTNVMGRNQKSLAGEKKENIQARSEVPTDLSNNFRSAADDLLELVFQLSIIFSTEEFLNAQPSSSLLVYFSGVLGFSLEGNNFLPAKLFTSYLSGLIYIQRLLFLEFALPFRPYHYLEIPHRPRLRQFDKLDSVRKKYMIVGAQSPLEEFQSLRSFGRIVARSDPPSYLLRWSDDGQTVYHGDILCLTMQNFRKLPGHFLKKAEVLCNELMFNLNPEIDLARVKDEIVNTESGFSFRMHPANKLDKAYLDLSVEACGTHRGELFKNGNWDWKAIHSYRKKAEALEEMLAGGLYTSGGQVPRAPEILGLECQNGPCTERGIYVWNGSMIYLTRHHKAKRSTNREFNVVRFLPVRLGHVLYKVLVYIRPFLELLDREEGNHNRPSRLLFHLGRDHDQPWDASRLTAILKKATAEVWGQAVNAQLYRQLTIGITERHVREIHKPFNRFDDVSAEADMNVVFAWQSGHRPIQRASVYGLDGAFPTQLQPPLLRAYEWASIRWHEFLHQPSKIISSKDEITMSDENPLSLISPNKRSLISQPCNDRPFKRKRQSSVMLDRNDHLTFEPAFSPENYINPVMRKTNLINIDDDPFEFLEEYSLLICRLHKYAIQNVQSHLYTLHSCLDARKRRRIVERYKTYQLANPDNIQLPQPGGLPLPTLQKPRLGFLCDNCDYITISRKSMRNHHNQVHDWKIIKNEKEHWQEVRVQTFCTNNGHQRWFIVEGDVNTEQNE